MSTVPCFLQHCYSFSLRPGSALEHFNQFLPTKSFHDSCAITGPALSSEGASQQEPLDLGSLRGPDTDPLHFAQQTRPGGPLARHPLSAVARHGVPRGKYKNKANQRWYFLRILTKLPRICRSRLPKPEAVVFYLIALDGFLFHELIQSPH